MRTFKDSRTTNGILKKVSRERATLSLGQRIDRYLDEEAWSKARSLILRARKKEPRSHWLLTRLSSAYLGEHRDLEALTASKRAFKRAPRCPLVLWDYANALDILKHHKQAIRIWKRLLTMRVERIAYDECGEGLRRARSLINDCRYRIGFSLAELGEFPTATHYIKEHLSHRSPGTPSIYSRAFVKRRLKHILKKGKIGGVPNGNAHAH